MNHFLQVNATTHPKNILITPIRCTESSLHLLIYWRRMTKDGISRYCHIAKKHLVKVVWPFRCYRHIHNVAYFWLLNISLFLTFLLIKRQYPERISVDPRGWNINSDSIRDEVSNKFHFKRDNFANLGTKEIENFRNIF